MQVTASSARMSNSRPSYRPSYSPPRRHTYQQQQPSRSGFPQNPADQQRPEAAATMSAPIGSGPIGMDLPSIRRNVAFVDTPDNVKDFATLQAMMEEIQQNIALRQDTISLLTGEVSRLQNQMDGTKGSMASIASMAAGVLPSANGNANGNGRASANGASAAAAAMAFPTPAFAAPNLFSGNSKKDVGLYGLSVAAVVFFGGVVAPVVEDKMGLGGPAYYDLITSRGLPTQMAEVDPIIASHSGGVVGIMTAQLLSGNKKKQQ